MLKIVAILDNKLDAGGGFDQAVNAILQMRKMSSGQYEFLVYTFVVENVEVLTALGIPSTYVKLSLLDHFYLRLNRNGWSLFLLPKLFSRNSLENKLIEAGCDLVYFVTPSPTSTLLRKINFIFTVWDLCHRDFPEFYEVRANGEFERRERILNSTLPKAVAVIVDSVVSAKKVEKYYSIDPERLIAMPFSASARNMNIDSAVVDTIKQKYGLTRPYIYYPAHLWPHKNHARVLESISLIKNTHDLKIDVVFSGKDLGNKTKLEQLAQDLGISDQLKFVGFVDSNHVGPLYINANCIVMPTYFGPTNIPPIEAWRLGVPIVYSDHLADQTADAAVLVDPDSIESVAKGIMTLQDENIRSEYVNRGYRRLKELEEERNLAEKCFGLCLKKFQTRMKFSNSRRLQNNSEQ